MKFELNEWKLIALFSGECYTFCRLESQCTVMGYHSASYAGRGVFYLDTQANSPFCSKICFVFNQFNNFTIKQLIIKLNAID